MLDKILSKRGKEKFSAEGYMYVFDRECQKDKNIKFWRCERAGRCKARIHTLDGEVIKSYNAHSHDASVEAVEVAKVVTNIKILAGNTFEGPVNVINECISNVPEDVKAFMPNKSALRKAIKRRRREATPSLADRSYYATGTSPCRSARDLVSSFEVVEVEVQSDESPSVASVSRAYRIDSSRAKRGPDDASETDGGTVIKARLADSEDTDFIEIELPRERVTYGSFVNICCKELGISPHQVDRLRKLPNTRMRCDADVERLEPYQEIEIVLNEMPQFVNVVSAEAFPSNVLTKIETELY